MAQCVYCVQGCGSVCGVWLGAGSLCGRVYVWVGVGL